MLKPFTGFFAALVFFALVLSTPGLAVSASPNDKLQSEARAIHAQMFSRDENTTPFRLVATFQANDYLGKQQGEGSIEELWLRPGTWKVTVRLSAATIRIYGHDDSYSISGGSFLPLISQRALRALRGVSPSTHDIDDASRFSQQEIDLGAAKLKCLLLEKKVAVDVPLKTPLTSFPTDSYCVDEHKVVRAKKTNFGWLQVNDNFFQAGGRYQPRAISLLLDGRERMKIRVSSVSFIPSLTEGDIAPAADASAYFQAAESTGKTAAVSPVRRKNDVRLERNEMVSGSGVLEAVVDRDGSVKDSDVVWSSSEDFAAFMKKLVERQTFTPALQNGKPIPMNYTVDSSH